MLAALGPMGFCLLLMPFMPNLWTTTLIVLAFFFAYYVYEPPYRGLYPDLLPPGALRPRAGRPARDARRRARDRARRRRLPAQGVAPSPVPARGGRDDARVRRDVLLVDEERRPRRTGLRGRPHLPLARAGGSSARSRTCGSSSRRTPRGRGRSPRRARSSSSTSPRGSRSRRRSPRRSSARSPSATWSLRSSRAASATGSGSRG